MPTHPEGPKAKDDDDKVNDVGEEHESVDVSGSSVLGVKDPPEETLGRLVHFVNTAVNNTTESEDNLRKNDQKCDYYYYNCCIHAVE